MASAPLPTDPDALRMFAASLQAELACKEIEIAANAAEIYAKTLHIEKLKMQLAVLRRAGVVATRREGNSIFYALRDPSAVELLAAAKRMVLANLTDSHALLRHLEKE